MGVAWVRESDHVQLVRSFTSLYMDFARVTPRAVPCALLRDGPTMRFLCLIALACTAADPATPSAPGSSMSGPPSLVTIDPSPSTFVMPQTCASGTNFCDEADGAGLLVRGPAHGRGAAWVDVDGDGWEDLWQSNDYTPGLISSMRSTLWRNLGDGTFEAFDLGIPNAHLDNNWSGAWGDVDNDGDPDLYVVNGGYGGENASRLYRNDLDTTGSFTDVTAASGLTLDVAAWWGATFGDYDRDGWLDVAIVARASLGFIPSSPGPTLLYHNNGDGTFTDVTATMGIAQRSGDHKNPLWIDINGDGWEDLFLASMTAPAMYINDGGVGFHTVSVAGAAPVFAAAVDDFNQDGIDDLYLGRQRHQEYILLGDPSWYTVLGPQAGLVTRANENTMGLTIGDITSDGWPDVLVGTGGQHFSSPGLLLCANPSQRRFQRCSDRGIMTPLTPGRHHGAAIADFDHDGDNDFFWNMGGSGRFDTANPGVDSRDLGRLQVRHTTLRDNTATVHLVGTMSNRSAVGARITVHGTREHHYKVGNAEGFQSQNSDWITVNLGNANRADIEVWWPSGVTTVTNIPAGSRVEIVE